MINGRKWIYCMAAVFVFSFLASSADTAREYYLSLYPNHYYFVPAEDIHIQVSLSYQGKLKSGTVHKIKFLAYAVSQEEENTLRNISHDKIWEQLKKRTPVKKWDEKVPMKPSGYDWQYAYTTIKFRLFEPSSYAIVSLWKEKQAVVFVKVTSLSVIVKSSPNKIVVFTQEIKSGKKMSDVNLTFSNEGKLLFKGRTNDNGLAVFTPESIDTDFTRLPSSITLHAEKEENRAQVSFSFSAEPAKLFKAYLYTDRPIYRPEQKVSFKGILRMEENGELKMPPSEPVEVKISDPKGNEVYKKSLKASALGNISDEFLLGAEPPLGQYSITATASGQTQYGTFKVEEYRKPEYEVTVIPDKKSSLQGEEVTAKVLAKYYFGAPVANTDYFYAISRSNYYPYRYRYWWDEEYGYYSSYSSTQIVAQGGGKTDEKGGGEIKFKSEKLDYDTSYTVTVKMTDASRREVSGSASLVATRGSFNLFLSADKYVYKTGEKAVIKITAQDYEGKGKASDVFITSYRGTYDRKGKLLESVADKRTIRTDAAGAGSYLLPVENDGSYRIDAYALDEKENKIAASTHFYASKEYGSTWSYSDQLSILPDKSSYEVGEKATVLLSCPYPEAQMLFTIEGQEIYRQAVLDCSKGAQPQDIEVREVYQPYVWLTVSVVYEKQLHTESKKLSVPAKNKFLTVKVQSQKDTYEPRETIKYILQTLNAKSQPVSAEVSLGVADESVYALASSPLPPIEKFFHGDRYSNVSTANSLWQWGGYYDYLDGGKGGMTEDAPGEEAPSPKKAMKDEDAKSVSEGEVQPSFVRTFFPDTAYFNPFILTDASGKAEVSFFLPDSLTTWRATSYAITPNHSVGQGESKIIVTKKVLVRLSAPRFFTERDSSTISALVHNYLKTEKKVRIQFALKGIETKDAVETFVQVPPEGVQRVDVTVLASKPGISKLQVKALTDEASDAMEISVPVLPHGTERFTAKAGDTESMDIATLALPEDAASNSASLRITVSPSIASTLLSSLEYLAGYPYGCVEQTMSRFLPNTVVQKTLQKLDITNEKLQKELPKMMKQGLDRLYNFHHSDGGWGWWENDASHPYMTAYVVYGLTLAKEANFKVDENKIKAGTEWLERKFTEEKDLATKAYMLYSMGIAGKSHPQWALELFEKRDKLNPYARALLAMTLHYAGKKDEARIIMANLEDSAESTGTAAFWKGQAFSHGWMDNEVETTAYVLKALLQIKPESPFVSPAVRYLSLSRKGVSWHSTKDTAAAIFALSDYIQARELAADYTGRIYVNDVLLDEVTFTKADVGKEGKTFVVLGGKLKPGENKLKFEKYGEGKLYYSAYLKYFTKEENIQSQPGGLKIKRTYVMKDGRPVTFPVKSGTVFNVKLEIVSDADYEYIMVEDPKPAGCEVIDSLEGGYKHGYWNYWFANREVRDEKVAYFSTYLYKGSQTLTYTVRAETPGKFHTMPSRISLMYLPEIGGTSDEKTVEIVD